MKYNRHLVLLSTKTAITTAIGTANLTAIAMPSARASMKEWRLLVAIT